MSEPVRPMPKPMITPEGHWEGRLFLSPESMDTRALFTIPLGPVIPIIVVPGIMGTNLRAKKRAANAEETNKQLSPGEAAWRAPNGTTQGLNEANTWRRRDPATRQKVLDGPTLEVDDGGEVILHSAYTDQGFTETHARARWWGELHADSYGRLMQVLEKNLNHVYAADKREGEAVRVSQYWMQVIGCDPKRWGVQSIAPLSTAELERVGLYQYPVYACGYNWLQSCADGASRLEERIKEVIRFWKDRRHKCDQVILVTHSMGGLVARACAKRVPTLIAGVAHGVMPALGAPACYRRIACGTETKNPSRGFIENIGGKVFSVIAGPTPESTTAVMATAPGALQLLPNHLYPRPWLKVGVEDRTSSGSRTIKWLLTHPTEEDAAPYDFYRDVKSWFRLINPAYADPAKKYKPPNFLLAAIRDAIGEAERFHCEVLGDYYHPTTYAYIGDDRDFLSFGEIAWLAKLEQGEAGSFVAPGKVRAATYRGQTKYGGRSISVGEQLLDFEIAEQNSAGDGTVPHSSGLGPSGRIKQLFAAKGFDHQGSYKNEAMLLLTHYVIAKIVQSTRMDAAWPKTRA